MKKYLYLLVITMIMLFGMGSCFAEMKMPEPGVYTRMGDKGVDGYLFIHKTPKGDTLFEVRAGIPEVIFAGIVKREERKIVARMDAKSDTSGGDEIDFIKDGGILINEWVCPVAMGKLKYYITTEDDIIDLFPSGEPFSTTTVGRAEVGGRYIKTDTVPHKAGPVLAAYVAEKFAQADAVDWKYGYMGNKSIGEGIDAIWLKSYDANGKIMDSYLVAEDLLTLSKNEERIW